MGILPGQNLSGFVPQTLAILIQSVIMRFDYISCMQLWLSELVLSALTALTCSEVSVQLLACFDMFRLTSSAIAAAATAWNRRERRTTGPPPAVITP